MTALHNLRFIFLPKNPLINLQKNPNNLPAKCSNCIGMCCIAIGFIGLTPQEQKTLLAGGTVWDALMFTKKDRIHMDSVKLLVEYHNNGKIPPDLKTYLLKLRKLVNLGQQEKRADRAILGPCGYLSSDATCRIYNRASRLIVCKNFSEGDFLCQIRFVARGSPAALEVGKILNNAAFYLNTFAFLITGNQRNIT